MNTLRLPIRFSASYAMESVVDGTEEFYATVLADSLRIEPGELPISTSFGVLDPSFEYQTPLKAVQSAARHIPEISIREVSSTLDNTGSVQVKVDFTIKES